MNKRQFLALASLALAALPAAAKKHPVKKAKPKKPAGRQGGTHASTYQGRGSPVLLTISGAIGRGNRGPLDPALDQMMVKQKLSFDKAYTFSFADIASLPATRINPTLEYDGKQHELSGPLLMDVLAVSGTRPTDNATVFLRAIDGYTVAPTMADIRKYRFILATHLDGKPMPLGGLGPLWAVYDADKFPELASKPVTERFGLCPWGIYHIEVKNA